MPTDATTRAAASPACPALDRTVVLVNGAAASNRALARRDEVAAAFGKRGLDPRVDVVPAASLRRTVRRLLREGITTFVAAGGDGTVGTVADAVAGADATVGVLPLGTFNHFARDAGVPLDLDAAVDVVCRGETSLVDVGTVNGRAFVNNASLGVYPDQVRLRDRLRTRTGKPLATFLAGLAALRRFRSLAVRLDVGGERFALRTPMVVVGNGPYGGEGGKVVERPRLDAGTLSVYVFGARGRFGLVASLLTGWAGHSDAIARFEERHVAEAVVHVRRARIPVALDGEVHRLRSPLRFRILPRALRILGPGRRP
jgi:YegS/Rv2252/BmrU family lipid kinase